MRSFFTLVLTLVCSVIFGQSIVLQPFNAQVDKATQDHLKAFSILAVDPTGVFIIGSKRHSSCGEL